MRRPQLLPQAIGRARPAEPVRGNIACPRKHFAFVCFAVFTGTKTRGNPIVKSMIKLSS